MIPRRPGQYLREQFRWRFVPHLTLVIGSLALALTSLALAVTRVLLAQRGFAWPLSLGAIALLLGVLSSRFETGDLDWVPWLKGLRGERLVATLLAPLENDGYRLLHDVETAYGNIDHVVIGPTGVFALETKHWSGRVWQRRGDLMHDGWNARETLRQTIRSSLEIKRRLGFVGLTSWVEAVVVSTKARVVGGRLVLNHVTVLPVDHLTGFITERRTQLSDMEIVRATAVVLRADAPLTVRAISIDAPITPNP